MNTLHEHFYRDLIAEVEQVSRLIELNANSVIMYIYSIVINSDITLNALMSIKKYHIDSYRHSIRVGIYGLTVSSYLRIDSITLIDICLACLLHDIGKTKIPVSLLDKQGKLTDSEFDVMKTHSTYSGHILNYLGYNNTIKWLAIHHSEKPLGGGYPSGYRNTQIHSQILAVCDIFDALTSKRAYKQPYDIARSIEIIQEEGFRGDIINVFITLSKSEVKNTGEEIQMFNR